MRKRVILKGRVQGVGCRGYCSRYAKKFSLHGSATNLRDGTVQLILEVHDESSFKKFLSSMITNSEGLLFYGSIDDISISDFSGDIAGDYNF